MQQVINHADILDLPFAYSSNGDGFIEHDMKAGTERYIYSDTAQKVLEGLLDKYSLNRNIDLTDTKILELKPFEDLGNPIKIVKSFGGKKKYIEVIKELQKEIYA